MDAQIHNYALEALFGETEQESDQAGLALAERTDENQLVLALLVLQVGLGHDSDAVCVRAARTLEKFGPRARDAANQLAEMVGYERGVVAVAAALALSQIEGSTQTALPALFRVLRTGEPDGKQAACRALAQLGVTTRTSLALLARTINDPDGETRLSAGRALVDLTVAASEAGMDRVARKALRALRAADDADTRLAAVGLLCEAPPSPAGVGFLAKGLRDSDRRLRRQCARQFAAWAEPAKSAQKALVAALNDPDQEVRGHAALALGGQSLRLSQVLPVLSQVAEQGPDELRGAAAALSNVLARSAAQARRRPALWGGRAGLLARVLTFFRGYFGGPSSRNMGA